MSAMQITHAFSADRTGVSCPAAAASAAAVPGASAGTAAAAPAPAMPPLRCAGLPCRRQRLIREQNKSFSSIGFARGSTGATAGCVPTYLGIHGQQAMSLIRPTMADHFDIKTKQPRSEPISQNTGCHPTRQRCRRRKLSPAAARHAAQLSALSAARVVSDRSAYQPEHAPSAAGARLWHRQTGR